MLGIILIMIITFVVLLFKTRYGRKKLFIFQKKRLSECFNLGNLYSEIIQFYKRKTNIVFHCEKVISKYYTKLIIFGETHDLNENIPIKISLDEKKPITTDDTVKITLKSDNGSGKEFLININYHMDNYYQILMDDYDDSLSIETIFYSKENEFFKDLNADKIIIKGYDNKNIPHLKRYNIINIPRKEFYVFFNNYSKNKLDEKTKSSLIKYNSLFINFIHRKENKFYEGKIFHKSEEKNININFNEAELNAINMTKEFLSQHIYKPKINIDDILIASLYMLKLNDQNINVNTINSIANKISNELFFAKYFGKKIENEFLELLEVGFFIEYISIVSVPLNAVKKFKIYLEKKNEIFQNDYEFDDFERLMIIVSLHKLILKYENIKLLKLYELPLHSPFVASEKIYLDIINKLNDNSALYFFYLQINSSSGFDYISSNTWYKIKYIPLIEIKSHILFSRFEFFFTFKQEDKVSAFIDGQTLVNNYNVSQFSPGYHFKENLEYEKSNNNTAKLLLYKFHENSHSKFYRNIINDLTPRYLYNFDLEILDSHYDKIIEYKLGKKVNISDKLGESTGEEGYAIEIFIYDDLRKTDILLNSHGDLKAFCDTSLYTGSNFDKLKKMISEIKIEKDIFKLIFDPPQNRTSNVLRIDNIDNSQSNINRRNRIQFFKNCLEIGKY